MEYKNMICVHLLLSGTRQQDQIISEHFLQRDNGDREEEEEEETKGTSTPVKAKSMKAEMCVWMFEQKTEHFLLKLTGPE